MKKAKGRMTMPKKRARSALAALMAAILLGTAPANAILERNGRDIQNETPVQKADQSVAPSAHMAFNELVGDNGVYGALTKRFPDKDTYRIVVDLRNNIMTVYNKADASIQRRMLCTTGKPSTPSPRGNLKMGKNRIRFGYFEEFECYAQYWVQITRNVYMHSVLYSKKNAKSLIKDSYRNLGKSVSHGCIRLTVPDARWIYENIAPGTEIQFTREKENKALKDSLKLPPIPKAPKKTKALKKAKASAASRKSKTSKKKQNPSSEK